MARPPGRQAASLLLLLLLGLASLPAPSHGAVYALSIPQILDRVRLLELRAALEVATPEAARFFRHWTSHEPPCLPTQPWRGLTCDLNDQVTGL